MILGETERAMELLDELLTSQSAETAEGIEANPAWDPIRDDPRFQAVLKKHRRESQ